MSQCDIKPYDIIGYPTSWSWQLQTHFAKYIQHDVTWNMKQHNIIGRHWHIPSLPIQVRERRVIKATADASHEGHHRRSFGLGQPRPSPLRQQNCASPSPSELALGNWFSGWLIDWLREWSSDGFFSEWYIHLPISCKKLVSELIDWLKDNSNDYNQ